MGAAVDEIAVDNTIKPLQQFVADVKDSFNNDGHTLKQQFTLNEANNVEALTCAANNYMGAGLSDPDAVAFVDASEMLKTAEVLKKLMKIKISVQTTVKKSLRK